MPYLVDGSFYILAVPAVEVTMLNIQYSNYVGRWLDMLEATAPNAVVIPVLTKCDLLIADRGDRSAAALEAAAGSQITWLLNAIDKHIALTPEGAPHGSRLLRIQRQVICVSAISGGEASVDSFRQRLEALVFAEPPLLQTIGAPVSRAISLTMVFLRALRDGRHPEDSARAADIGYIPSAMSTEQRKTCMFIDYEEVKRRYFDEFVQALKINVQGDEALKDVVKMLAAQGEVTLAPGGIIHLHPGWVQTVFQPLCDTRMGNRLWQSRTLATAESVRATVMNSTMKDAEKASVVVAAECLAKTGELREELLPVMWEPLGLKRDEYGAAMLLLAQSGLAVMQENVHEGRRWVLPHWLPDANTNEALESWHAATKGKHLETLRISISLNHSCPPGVFQQILYAVQGLGHFGRVWKTGAHLRTRSLRDVEEVLIRIREPTKDGKRSGTRRPSVDRTSHDEVEAPAPAQSDETSSKDRTNYELTIEGCGQRTNRLGIWASLLHLKDLAKVAIDGVPGLAKRVTYTLRCPGCVESAQRNIHYWPLELITKKPMTCEVCSEAIELHTAEISGRVEGGAASDSLILEPVDNEPELRYLAAKVRCGRPIEASYSLYNILGLADAEAADALKAAGEAAIVAEFEHQYRESTKGGGERKDEHGWTDFDWLTYFLGPSAGGDEASANGATKYSKLLFQARKSGYDADRKDLSLDAFIADKISAGAGLTRGHALALRLYSSSVSSTINKCLHDGCSLRRPHPYPATVLLLVDALWRLRSAQNDHRIAVKQRAATLAEAARKAKDDIDIDDAAKALAATKAADAAAAFEALQVFTFWRGVSNLNPGEFKERGGTELSFMSLNKNKPAAQEAALQGFHATQRAEEQQRRDERDAAKAAMAALENGQTSPDGSSRRTSMSLNPDASASGAQLRRISNDLVDPDMIEVMASLQNGGATEDEEVQDEADEDKIYLALAPPGDVTQAASTEPPRRATVVTEEATSSKKPARAPSPSGAKQRRSATPDGSSPNPGEGGRGLELPVLLFRVVTTEENLPVDVSSFSVSAGSGEYVYPPGVYIEQRKESPESLGTGDDGEDVACKVAEVAMHVTRASGMGKGAKPAATAGA